MTAIDSSLIKDLNVDGNRIWFKLDGLDNQEDLEFFVQEICKEFLLFNFQFFLYFINLKWNEVGKEETI